MNYLTSLTIVVVILFNCSNIFAQESDLAKKNQFTLAAKYNWQTLRYKRNFDQFNLRLSINSHRFTPDKEYMHLYKMGPMLSLGLPPFLHEGYMPIDITDTTVTYLFSRNEKGFETDIRIGIERQIVLSQITLNFGADFIYGKRTISEDIVHGVVGYEKDSISGEIIYDPFYNPIEYPNDHFISQVYNYNKMGVSPFIATTFPIKRWRVEIEYAPEFSWINRTSSDTPQFVIEETYVRRTKLQNQMGIGVGYTF